MKLSIDEFRKIKDELLAIYDKMDEDIDDSLSNKLLNEYFNIQKKLLSYDLSDIPFEEWYGVSICSDPEYTADFSKTNANIDFNIISTDFYNANFKNCNVRNITYEVLKDDNIFDKSQLTSVPIEELYSKYNEFVDTIRKIYGDDEVKKILIDYFNIFNCFGTKINNFTFEDIFLKYYDKSDLKKSFLMSMKVYAITDWQTMLIISEDGTIIGCPKWMYETLDEINEISIPNQLHGTNNIVLDNNKKELLELFKKEQRNILFELINDNADALYSLLELIEKYRVTDDINGTCLKAIKEFLITYNHFELAVVDDNYNFLVYPLYLKDIIDDINNVSISTYNVGKKCAKINTDDKDFLNSLDRWTWVYMDKDRFCKIFEFLKNVKNTVTDDVIIEKITSNIEDVITMDIDDVYIDVISDCIKNKDYEKIDYVYNVLLSLHYSNSSEVVRLERELAIQILKSDNPELITKEVEDIFLKNNLPFVGKTYNVFDKLHPNLEGFHFDKEDNMLSPILNKSSNYEKKMIVFSDLIKCAFGSNNKSIINYLDNLEKGSKLFDDIKSGKIDYDNMDEYSKNTLETFFKHLETMYNNTYAVKKDGVPFISSGDIVRDIKEIAEEISIDGTLDYNLGDRIVRMFCGMAGINTIKEAEYYLEKKVKDADLRNREASSKKFKLKKGDLIKGIGNVNYLGNILQNGSVSKEYLGSSAGSDLTPLDTDVSMILDDYGTIEEKIDKTASSHYGPIWFVLKNDDRFITTRTKDENNNVKRDLSKIELFYTGANGDEHYGIRTGFASSEIDYIMVKENNPKIGLEIVMNGFYIPVVNTEGEILFTPEDYDKLREKMQGLSHFGLLNYKFSDNLKTKEIESIVEIEDESNREVSSKRNKIINVIKKSLEDVGIQLKHGIDGNLTEGFAELIDTGSTGRGTNKLGDGDFDFMLRLDNRILIGRENNIFSDLKNKLIANFGDIKEQNVTGEGDFRFKGVKLDDETEVDIDITFTQRTDKLNYSTDMCLQDRLYTIKCNDPEKYKYVVANIIEAKKILKAAKCYKPNKGNEPQGGLGGVGVENWILQNGGSFIDAAKSFIECAERKNFETFKQSYSIWDFGENHLADKKSFYPHDNFVDRNMSDEGYSKMVTALKEYIRSVELEDNISDNITSERVRS